MKKYLIAGVLLVKIAIAFSQTQVEYTYDAMGNRLARQIIPLDKSMPVDQLANTYSSDLDEHKIKLFPNPTMGHLNLEISAWEKELVTYISIYDNNGKTIQGIVPENEKTQIDLSTYPTGIYIIRLSIDNKWTEWKVIKK